MQRWEYSKAKQGWGIANTGCYEATKKWRRNGVGVSKYIGMGAAEQGGLQISRDGKEFSFTGMECI